MSSSAAEGEALPVSAAPVIRHSTPLFVTFFVLFSRVTRALYAVAEIVLALIFGSTPIKPPSNPLDEQWRRYRVFILCLLYSAATLLVGVGIIGVRPPTVNEVSTVRTVDMDARITAVESFDKLGGYAEEVNLARTDATYYPSDLDVRGQTQSADNALAATGPKVSPLDVPPLKDTIDAIVTGVQNLGGDAWTLASKVDGWAIINSTDFQLRQQRVPISSVWTSTTTPNTFNDSGKTWHFYDKFMDTGIGADRASSVFGNLNAMMCVSNITLSRYMWIRRGALNVTSPFYQQMLSKDLACIQDRSACASVLSSDLGECLAYSGGDSRKALEYIFMHSPELIYNEHASGRWASGSYLIFKGQAGSRQGVVFDHSQQMDYLSVPGSIFNYYSRTWKSVLAVVATGWAGTFIKDQQSGIDMLYSPRDITLYQYAIQCFGGGDITAARKEHISSNPKYFLDASQSLRVYQGQSKDSFNRACQILRSTNMSNETLLSMDSIVYCDVACKASCVIPSTTGLTLYLQEDGCANKNFKSGIDVVGALQKCYALDPSTLTAPAKAATPALDSIKSANRVLFLANAAVKLRVNVTSAYDEVVWLFLNLHTSLLIQEPQLTRAAKNLEYGGLLSTVRLHQTSGQANSYSVIIYAGLIVTELYVLMRVFRFVSTEFAYRSTKMISLPRLVLDTGFGSAATVIGPGSRAVFLIRIACLLALYSECLTQRVVRSGRSFTEFNVFTFSNAPLAAAINYSALCLLSILFTCLAAKTVQGSIAKNFLHCLVATTLQVVMAAFTGTLYTTANQYSTYEFEISGVIIACDCTLLVAGTVFVTTVVVPFYTYELNRLRAHQEGAVPDALRKRILSGEVDVGPNDRIGDSTSRIWIYWTILAAQQQLTILANCFDARKGYFVGGSGSSVAPDSVMLMSTREGDLGPVDDEGNESPIKGSPLLGPRIMSVPAAVDGKYQQIEDIEREQLKLIQKGYI